MLWDLLKPTPRSSLIIYQMPTLLYLLHTLSCRTPCQILFTITVTYVILLFPCPFCSVNIRTFYTTYYVLITTTVFYLSLIMNDMVVTSFTWRLLSIWFIWIRILIPSWPACNKIVSKGLVSLDNTALGNPLTTFTI